MRTHNQHYLVMIALGSDHSNILEAFTKSSRQCGANIIESKITSLGQECVFFCHFSGTWNSIAKLEAVLPDLAEQYHLAIQCKRTSPRQTFPQALPYQVQVIAQDRPGILNDLATFFRSYGILIDKMDCETHISKNNTPITHIHFLVNVPTKQHIASLRERFITYCEDRNLDALMEPLKG